MATRMRWLGHACLLFQSDGGTVLIDPFLSSNPTAAAKPEELNPDFILVSHGHGDHLGDTVPIAQRTGATVIANYEIAGWLQKHGVQSTHGMQHGGGHQFPFGRVKLTLAFHGSQLPDGSDGGNPCGFLITFQDGKKVYDAADTGLFGDMRLIGEEGVDLALLPIHFNTFPPIRQDAAAWAERVRKETKAEPVVLTPGQWADV